MTFASVAALFFLTLLGLGTVVAACSARRLIAWENRALTALADTLRERRLSLEEDAMLLCSRAQESGTRNQVISHDFEEIISHAA